MCYMMSIKDLFLIYIGVKYATMRPTTDRHKVGGIYQIKLNLFDKYSFKVKILSKELINLDDLAAHDLDGIGYSKEEYLKQPYNLKNASKMRYKYTFKLVETDAARLKELNIL